jgi:hypothetical protein
LSPPEGAFLTWVTTVWPLTVRVVVVTLTPEAVVVATECVTRGPAAADVPAGAALAADGDAAAVVCDAWCARATTAVPVPAISAAAVQLDIRRACRRLFRRAAARLDGSMFASFHAVP